jgi:nitric oxide reductase large subunit
VAQTPRLPRFARKDGRQQKTTSYLKNIFTLFTHMLDLRKNNFVLLICFEYDKICDRNFYRTAFCFPNHHKYCDRKVYRWWLIRKKWVICPENAGCF